MPGNCLFSNSCNYIFQIWVLVAFTDLLDRLRFVCMQYACSSGYIE